MSAEMISLRVISPDSGRNPDTNAHKSSLSMTGIIPAPVARFVMYVTICDSTVASVSPFSIPRAGMSFPVYFTHWSEVISVHPLKQFEQDIYLYFRSFTLDAIMFTENAFA
jgi:hypothetical protein